ncbi:MAG: hypothetical protein JXB32_03260 [Deltaproteobacteria bacterium]|nr:hypothetical protein [Deltaproteobacteria bacterium]
MPLARPDGPRTSLGAALAVVLLAAAPVSAQSATPYGLLVVAPVEGGVAADVVAALAEGLGPPSPGGPRTVRRCAAAEGAVTPSVLAAAFDRAQREFFLGRFDEAEQELDGWLEALVGGCRPLSSSPETWTPPAAVAVLHDLGALLLATARELDRTSAAEATLRRLLATFPGARPTDGMFPPSLADRYLDLEPDETEVGWVVVDAPGCEVNVGGCVASGRARVPAGPVRVGLRCADEDALVVELTVAAGETVRFAAPSAVLPAGTSRGDRTLLRAAALAAALTREAAGVAVEERAGRVRVAVWRSPDGGGVLASVTDVGEVEPWVRGVLAGERAAGGSGDDAGWWGPLVLGLAGAALGAGGGWALEDGRARGELAERAATVTAHDRLVEEAGLLDAAGWTLVGVGAAALVGAAVWLALEFAGGTEASADAAAEGPILVPAGPGVLGFGIAF